MNGFSAPSECPKCGGAMREGLTAINSEGVRYAEGHPALGPRVTLGGSCSWWALAVPERPGMAEKVLTGGPWQVFVYRCEQCGFLESYAP